MAEKKEVQLPKHAINEINLGHSFAEYDELLKNSFVFVETPAIRSAVERGRTKCLFVGRRGTGKTAITRYLSTRRPRPRTTILSPATLSSVDLSLPTEEFSDTRQRPFRMLSHAIKRALLDEVAHEWLSSNIIANYELTGPLGRERNFIEETDFDLRLLSIVEEMREDIKREKSSLQFLKRPRLIGEALNSLAGANAAFTILIDRIDDDWDGSDVAVTMLMALMHGCVQLTSEFDFIRPLIFVRENIFERVRERDNEFGRLETWIVSLDWTEPLLLELIERRLAAPFNTKPPLGGPTWDHFFEKVDGDSSYKHVFSHCQLRPRDVLTYCDYAIEGARAQKHTQVTVTDLNAAKKRFSDSRLKDLGDEYSENFPQIQLVLFRFFGLGTRFTISGISDFIRALLADDAIKKNCATWIFAHQSPEVFIDLLYRIGFVGIDNGNGAVFRSPGARAQTLPPIDASTQFVIHGAFSDALQLRDSIIRTLDDTALREDGILPDLPPGTINLQEYNASVTELMDELKTLPTGDADAERFETLVGNVLKMCFFHVFHNVEPQVRNHNGKVRRDWIVSNVARAGFWESIRIRYKATQVIWECKNYAELGADDFHQISYYLTAPIGSFGIICFRGEPSKSYYQHIQRIAHDKDGIVLLITDKDLQVFLRQAKHGRVKDSHINDIFARTVRAVS